MAINWPSLAQGAGTGTTYTAPSPGSNLWTWNGYSWGSTGTTAKGGFAGPWVIFDSYGKARAFSTLPDAIAVATSGQTIHLFQNTTEYPTVDKYIDLNVDLNFNLNGYTYTINGGYVRSDGTIGYDFPYIIVNNGYEVNINMYNGEIHLTNAGPSTVLIFEIGILFYLDKGCNWNFSSFKFSKDSGNDAVAVFTSSVTGGIFEDTSPDSLYYSVKIQPTPAPNATLVIFKDIVCTSEKAQGISFFEGSNNFTVLAINCKGYSNANTVSDDIPGITTYNDYNDTDDTNRFRLIGCEGINNYDAADVDGIGFGITTEGRFTLIKCAGLSSIGGGIKSDHSTLIHCTGEGGASGAGPAFYSVGGSNLRKCSSNSSSIIGLRTAGVLGFGVTGENIEGCSFHSNYPIYGPGGDTGNYINIHNCTLNGFNYGMYYAVNLYKTNIANCSISPESSYNVDPFTNDFYPVTIQATGSYVVNNVLSGRGTLSAIGEGAAGPKSIYITHNTCIDVEDLFPYFSSITQGMTSTSDNQNNIQQNI